MKLPTILLSVFTVALIQGCNHTYDEPRPDVFTLENIDRLVVEDILIPEKLDPRDREYQYISGAADLNGDNSEELLVLMQDPYFCGTGGCSAFLFNETGEVLQRMTVTNMPILLSNKETNGWLDFYVWSDGALRVISNGGSGYPSNPSTQPEYDRTLELKAAKQLLEVQPYFVEDGDEIELLDSPTIFAPARSYQFQFTRFSMPDNVFYFTIDMLTGERELTSKSDSN